MLNAECGYLGRLDYFDALHKGQMTKTLLDRVETLVVIVQIELVRFFLQFNRHSNNYEFFFIFTKYSHLALEFNQGHVLVRMHVAYDPHVLN